MKGEREATRAMNARDVGGLGGEQEGERKKRPKRGKKKPNTIGP